MATITMQVCDGCGRKVELAPTKLAIPNTLWVGEHCKRCIKRLERYMEEMGMDRQRTVGTQLGAPRRTLREQLLDVQI